MEKKYTLLSGETVSLEELEPREEEFLDTLMGMPRSDISYFEIYRMAIGPGSIALQGRNQVNRSILKSPLYVAARDIATRAGIAQGLILAPEYEDERAKAPQDFSMISVQQAANLIGVSRAAVYKAIEKGKLRGHKIGNVTVVEKSSALDYRDKRNAGELTRDVLAEVKTPDLTPTAVPARKARSKGEAVSHRRYAKKKASKPS